MFTSVAGVADLAQPVVYLPQPQRAALPAARLLVSPTRTIQVRGGEDDAAHIVRILTKKDHKAHAEQRGGVWVVWLESEEAK